MNMSENANVAFAWGEHIEALDGVSDNWDRAIFLSWTINNKARVLFHDINPKLECDSFEIDVPVENIRKAYW